MLVKKVIGHFVWVALSIMLLISCGESPVQGGGDGSEDVLPTPTPEPQESHLPRASAEEMSTFKRLGDLVFQDVWTEACYELHSLMVVRDGKVLYERWANGHSPEELHILWSVSKTFTALAVGLAVDEGLLKVEDAIKQFFSTEELPESETVWGNKMNVWHLLTMSSGIAGDYIGLGVGGHDFDWAQKTLRSGISFAPGSKFHYNSMNSYLLSVIVSRVTGKKVVDYLAEKLFEPLGIVDYIWEESPQGYNSGGWGLYLSTESLAKVGQLMLQGGVWEGVQLISQEWIKAMMAPQIMQYKGIIFDEQEQQAIVASGDQGQQGYGYQMWCCTNGAVRMDGAWSQFVILFPKQNSVVVTTAHSANNSGLLSSIWSRIYPNL